MTSLGLALVDSPRAADLLTTMKGLVEPARRDFGGFAGPAKAGLVLFLPTARFTDSAGKADFRLLVIRRTLSMQIRRLEIQRFRGIRKLNWDLDGSFICLVGPGDSAKTTILDAIELALTSRYTVAFTDSDFYQSDVSEPLIIRVTVADLPSDLCRDSKYLDCLQGWSERERLVDEPEDGCDRALTIELKVDETLQPRWAAVTARNPDGRMIACGDREILGVTRLGEDVTRHFGWARGSALTRLGGGTEGLLAAVAVAQRESRRGFDGKKLQSLASAASKAQSLAKGLGVRLTGDLIPALDSRALALGQTAVCLHDGEVPLRAAGTGTQRLLAVALQSELLHQGGIALVDEVERGLEPFRICHVVRVFQDSVARQATETNSTAKACQVICTTHSPTVVAEVPVSGLRVVRTSGGEVAVRDIPEANQGLMRQQPTALLSQKIWVCEGKTELGLTRALGRYWAKQQNGQSLAYRSVDCVGGLGDPEGWRAAIALARLGYDVLYLGDTDGQTTEPPHEATDGGVRSCLWEGGLSVEERLALDLPADALKAVVDAAVRVFGAQPVYDRIRDFLAEPFVEPSEWFRETGGSVARAVREAVGRAAKGSKNSRGWFKNIGMGEELGEVLVRALPAMGGTPTAVVLSEIEAWVYDG